MKRRAFISKTGLTLMGGIVAPTIVPSSVFGKNSPSNRITIGMIGTGRQAVNANLKDGFLVLDNCQVVAVNDVDSWRMKTAKGVVEEAYSKKTGNSFKGVTEYDDYRELLANKDIDAVMISTPDHWHVHTAVAAALEGKHISVEKALSVCFSWGESLVGAAKANKVANRLDSEFRSSKTFWKAVELVHNGAIGKLIRVDVGVPAPLNGVAIGPQPEMAIPEELNYDMWLGTAFPKPYTMQRVHERNVINVRPGWMRIEDYCNGMITNWGAHLVDIALWGMNKERERPATIEGTGEFSKGLWNTIESFQIQYTYKDGMVMNFKTDQPYVKFFGEGGRITAGYPATLDASDAGILEVKGAVSYAGVRTDKADFLHAVETGLETLEPLETGQNVYATTNFGIIAIKLGRMLRWNDDLNQFADDTAANGMLNRPFRERWIDKKVSDWVNKYQEVKLK